MVRIQDPDDGSGGGGGGGTGGGGVPPTLPWLRLTPADTTVSVGGTPVTLIASWGNLSTNPTLSPGSPALTNGGAVVVSPASTTTYTLTDGTRSTTATVTVGQPSSSVLRYPKVQWVFTEPYPLGSVVGFDVLFFIGTDPTDTTSWVMLPIRCEAADRELIYPVRMVPPVQLSVAVRAVYEYADRKSDWYVIGAPVTFQ